MNTISKKIFVLAFGLGTATIALSQDPGTPGPLAVTVTSYDFGDLAFNPPSFPNDVEVRASVFHPTDLSSGPFPLVIILHGRHSTCYLGAATALAWPCTGGYSPIDSYEGYDYLATNLASHGYIVASISANAISATDNSSPDYGMAARGELVQHHLDLWNNWNSVSSAPFGATFVGKVDMTNIGTLGHSRGGEGVIENALYNISLGSPYGINAVLTLAPVDFGRPVLTGTAVMNIAPYCDGDVSDLQGVHFYDDARYLDPDDGSPKYNLLMLGANHNYYNTVWTPGGWPAGTADDWQWANPAQNDAHCGTSSATNARFDAPTQRNSLLAYGSAFFRYHLGGETAFKPLLEVDDIVPPPSATLTTDEIFMSFHPGVDYRVEVNREDLETDETTNTLGMPVTSNGLVAYDICGDDWGEQYCIGAGASQEPHNKNGSVAMLGLSQVALQWNSADDWYRNDLPGYLYDLTQFSALQFRAAVNFSTNPAGVDQNFRVELTDGTGASSSVLVSSYSTALYDPPGATGTTVPHSMHNTIKIPLSAFSGVDITDVQYIRFLFNGVAAGAILVSDLMFVSNLPVEFAPIAAFTASPLTTCTGQVNFTDESIFNPDTWDWDFGDGNTSTLQNPSHTYAFDGTYTVTLIASNPTGSDTYTEVAYVVVDKPDAPNVVNDTICSGDNANLSAGSVSGGTLDWYDAPTGGTLLGSGTLYADSPLSTTSYWVTESVSNPTLSVGPPDNTFGTGGYLTASDTRGIFFDAYSDFILESVRVYSGEANTRTIQVLDGDGGSVVHTGDFFIPAGESVVNLDWLITPYTQYYIKVTNFPVNLFRINDASPTYPYTLPGIVSLTGSNVAGNELDYYYFFFDWKVRQPDCISEPAEAVAVVNPLPTITTSGDVTIVGGTSTALNATGGVTYSWSPVTGLDDPNIANPNANPTSTTTYTVTVTDANGCSDVSSLTVTVDGQLGMDEELSPSLSVFPNPTSSVIQVSVRNLASAFVLKVISPDGKILVNRQVVNPKEMVELDLSRFADGVYLVEIRNDEVNFVRKIVLE